MYALLIVIKINIFSTVITTLQNDLKKYTYCGTAKFWDIGYFLMIRVEEQNINQRALVWQTFVWVFGV